jgi:hypothetical protein
MEFVFRCNITDLPILYQELRKLQALEQVLGNNSKIILPTGQSLIDVIGKLAELSKMQGDCTTTIPLANGVYKKRKFSLKVPDIRLPNYSISDSLVQWRLNGIINKRLKKDLSVSYPIIVN